VDGPALEIEVQNRLQGYLAPMGDVKEGVTHQEMVSFTGFFLSEARTVSLLLTGHGMVDTGH